MATTRFNPRERQLAVAVAVLLGSWVAVTWLMEPLWFRVQRLEQQTGAQDLKLQKLGALLARRRSIEQRYQAIATYLTSEGEADGQGASFLGELETLAQQANVQLNLKPRPLEQGGHVNRFPVELTVQGTQAGLLEFLDAFLSMPRLVEVHRLTIAVAPGRPGLLKSQLFVEHLTLLD